METKVNYFIVGLFVLALTLAIIGTAVWLAGGSTTESYRTYLTYINESVAGLSPKAPVKFNGVEVGHVENISLNPYNPQQVRLELKIADTTPVTEATRATVQTQGITGLMFVALRADKIMSQPLKKIPSEPYPVIKSAPSLYLRIDQAVQGISDSVKQVFNDENKAAIKDILHNLDVATRTVAANSQAIDETLKSARTLSINTAKASERLPQVIEELDAASAELKKFANLGKRSLRDITEETLPETQQIMLRLKNSLNNIELITDDMAKNPAVIVRGKTVAKPGPGEK